MTRCMMFVTMVIGMLAAAAPPASAEETAAPPAPEAAKAEDAVTPPAPAEEAEEEVVGDEDLFFVTLANTPNGTIEDAYRITYILLTGNQQEVSFSKLRGYLLLRRVINQGWRHKRAGELVTYGEVGFLVGRAIDLQGGVVHTFTRLLGFPTERYTYRECVFRGIIPASNPRDYVSGAELLSILQRAAEVREMQRLGAGEKTAADEYGEIAEEEAAEEGAAEKGAEEPPTGEAPAEAGAGNSSAAEAPKPPAEEAPTAK